MNTTNGWEQPATPRRRHGVLTIVLVIVASILVILAACAAALVVSVGRGMEGLDNLAISGVTATDDLGHSAIVITTDGDVAGEQCYRLVLTNEPNSLEPECLAALGSNEVQIAGRRGGAIFGGAGSAVKTVEVTYSNGKTLPANVDDIPDANSSVWVVKEAMAAKPTAVVGFDGAHKAIALADVKAK